MPSLEAHTILDETEREVKDTLNVLLTAHFDPIDLQDNEAIQLELRMREAIKDIEQSFELHDFRLVRGVLNKIIFDVEAPYSCKKTNDELQHIIEQAVHGITDYETRIRIERK